MKHNTKNFYKSTFLFFLFTVFLFFRVQGQSKDIQVTDSTQVIDKAISIGNISEESEILDQRIIKLREILKPSAKIIEVDSLLNLAFEEIKNNKDSLLKLIDHMNRRDLKVSKIEWKEYHSNVRNAQSILKDRTEEVTNIHDEIDLALNKWRKAKEKLVSTNESKDILTSLEYIIQTLQEISQATYERLNSVFSIQKELTKQILTIDEAITEIGLAELQIQKDYFVFDSEPIWKSKNVGITVLDSTTVKSNSFSDRIQSGLKKNKDQINEFISQNSKTAILQILFILTVLALIFRVNSNWKNHVNELINPIEKQAEVVLSNPISASVVLGILISAFFYDRLVPAFAELHILLILIGTIILLPKLTNKRFRLFLYLIFFVYLFHTYEVLLDSKTNLLRWGMIMEAIVLIISLVLGARIIRKTPELFEPINKIFNVFALIYITILIVSILANIFGMVSLSGLLINGILTSTVLGLVVYLSIKIVTSLVLLFFKLRKNYNIQALSTMVNATNQRVRPILNWVGLFVWFMFTLKGFDVYKFIFTGINDLMLVTWEIGKMTISLGGMLSFLTIFIVTLILAKLIATIFLDDWMIKILPRGVAPAISLVLRIMVVGIGLYIALSAAGIDLSKLSWMFGALGVGIGFGLQNIVLNFISGLILAFERPINLGDTIEIDQEMGIVTNIGIRSSNIKSYSGYEAIIPNGDLISKKVINYTLSNRDRRSKILMKTAPNADPEKVITLFNEMALDDPRVRSNPAPKTYFYGYDENGSLSFALLYWTTFSDTLKTDSAIALKIFAKLKEEGIQSPAPVRRIVKEK